MFDPTNTFVILCMGLQEALASRDIATVRSAAKAAKAAFQDCEYAEGVAKAEALEAQAEAIEGGERAAREGSEALAAGRAALASGQLEEARRQAGRARERFSTEGLGDVGRKGLEGVGELERGVAEAETKAGHVREGLEVRLAFWCFFLFTIRLKCIWQALEGAEKAMRAGQWEESAALIAQARQLLQRGEASNSDKQRAAVLFDRLRAGKESSEARKLGLEALESGTWLIPVQPPIFT